MSRARSFLATLLMSPLTARASRLWHDTGRRLGRKPHTIIYYHRVADAWSGLLAQILPRLLNEYDVKIKIKLVSSLAIDCAPDPQRLDRYAVHDAIRLARAWGLHFPDDAQSASQRLVDLAQRVILAQSDDAIDSLATTTAAVWRSDEAMLSKMAENHGAVDEGQATTRLAANARDLRRRGHYQGGMLWFQGEWFWGLDRLDLLEERLCEARLNRHDQTLASRLFRPLDRSMAGTALPMDLEFYFSFRSPYSYLAAIRIVELVDRLGLRLVLRPVMPMVTRGIPVPSRKLHYIIKDVARVARHRNVAFGPIRDPLGSGVERCLAVAHLAKGRSAEREFMLAAMRAIWCEAADLTRNSVLQRVAATAGLTAADVERATGSASWRAQVEANAASLAVLGLWGVPGLCLRGPDDKPVAVAWGQDRLWAIERAALGLDVAMPPPRLVQ